MVGLFVCKYSIKGVTMFKLSESQLSRMFRSAPVFSVEGGKSIRAYHEITTTDEQGVMTETEFLFCREGDLKQGDIVTVENQRFKVQYVKRNGDNTSDCFITLAGVHMLATVNNMPRLKIKRALQDIIEQDLGLALNVEQTQQGFSDSVVCWITGMNETYTRSVVVMQCKLNALSKCNCILRFMKPKFMRVFAR